ncbi:MAG TPA: RsmB/NOP family class I SAM-dependent RNA methyltransferase, partial [Alphaproteobacteria bacterium]|nr:RsmB/NOP family class I SAM-dependent RNA methyltransferase [Alphaproteobacteria bacterium]
MTPSARLQAVLDLLSAIASTPRPADALVSDYFRARRYIGSHDRAAVSFMLYDALRHFARLNWWVENVHSHKGGRSPSPLGGKGWDGGSMQEIDPPPAKTKGLAALESATTPRFSLPPPQGGRNITATSRRRFLAYLALVEKMPLRRIDALCDGEKFAPAPLTDGERAFLRKLETHTLAHPHMPENVAVECPDWAYASLKKRFGKNFAREMAALLRPAPLDLRVNALKTTKGHALNELAKAGFKAEPCRFSPLGIRLHERPSLAALALLKEGRAEIQDEGSQLVAALVDAKPGMRVMDFCAGAGGKTLAIAAQMQNKGRVTACDVLEKRLKRSAERFRRAGVFNITIKPLKNEHDPWIKKHKGTFDRVLVDAPCTGIGAWRRNPDARWRTSANGESAGGENANASLPALGPGLEALTKLQTEILDSAARLVKKSGRLIYATCSLLPEENEKQIEKFLEAHKDFRLIPLSEVWNSIFDMQGRPDSSPLVGEVRRGGHRQERNS